MLLLPLTATTTRSWAPVPGGTVQPTWVFDIHLWKNRRREKIRGRVREEGKERERGKKREREFYTPRT